MARKPLFRRKQTNSLWRDIVAGGVAGAVASYVKLLIEPPLQRIAERIFPPTEDEKRQPGADAIGRPENMPPAVLVKDVAEATGAEQPSFDTQMAGVKTIHYSFGIGSAIVYSMLAERFPAARKAFGLYAGVALWLGTHNSLVPLFGLQGAPWRMPRSWWVWEMGSHLGYAVTVEAVRWVIRGALRSR